MKALVSPCSKGVSGRCCIGDPADSRPRWATGAAPARWSGLRSSHVATVRGGLGGLPFIFPQRRAVILPVFPPPPRDISSRALYITFDTFLVDADSKTTQHQSQTSESLKIVREPEATDIQTQMASELQKVVAEMENGKPQAQIPGESQTTVELLKADAYTQTTKYETQTMGGSRTVRVRFKLQRSCQFGEHFLLVGEDRILGQWDPASAVPLLWSDGHVWMAQLDLPVGKEMKFKFILQRISGEFEWQPGPDRVLQTWETVNTIVVEYGWERAEDKNITEEKSLAIRLEREAPRESGMGTDSGTVENKKRQHSMEIDSGIVENQRRANVVESDSQTVESQIRQHGMETDSEIAENQIVDTNAERESILKIAEDKHVFPKEAQLPGLAIMLTSASVNASEEEVCGKLDGALSREINGRIQEGVPDKVDEIEHQHENAHEAVSIAGHPRTDSHLASGHDSEEGDPRPEANILENDFDWGRHLRRFLMTLGLFQEETN